MAVRIVSQDDIEAEEFGLVDVVASGSPDADALIPDEPDDLYYSKVYWVPDDTAFGQREYLSASHLGKIADRLIDKHRMAADEFTVEFLWKRKAGNSGGKPVFGSTVKLSGLAKHFNGADFVVWIAANHAREARLTNYQIEALLFHELLHIDMTETPDGEYNAVLRKHDFTGFIAELDAYGDWQADLQNAKEAFVQARLIPDGFR